MDLSLYYALHWAGISFPLAAGLLVFGWRAMGMLAVMLGCAWAAGAVWRRIGRRGAQIHYSHLLYLAALLAAALPAQLLAWRLPGQAGSNGIGLLLPGAALLLVMACWLFGGTGSNRVHPVALTILVLCMLFPALLVPRSVLKPSRLFFGDVLDAGSAIGLVWGQPWTDLPDNSSHAAVYAWPAESQLIGYTRGTEQPTMSSMSLGDLLRDRLAPLEDLVVAGQPAPIGSASAIFVIVGGLMLMYNGVIDYRIPLLVVAAAYAAFIFLPVPVSIQSSSVTWRWLAMRDPHVGWEMGLTFANYELLAGPLLLVAFFMATWPACRPMYRRGRAIYAITLGLLAAALQLYLDVGYGAYLALMLASLLTPVLDTWMRPRALV
jgi:Na+-translocating ferredoxin:NAD+ oxidoreductase RnfD subunit